MKTHISQQIAGGRLPKLLEYNCLEATVVVT